MLVRIFRDVVDLIRVRAWGYESKLCIHIFDTRAQCMWDARDKYCQGDHLCWYMYLSRMLYFEMRQGVTSCTSNDGITIENGTLALGRVIAKGDST